MCTNQKLVTFSFEVQFTTTHSGYVPIDVEKLHLLIEIFFVWRMEKNFTGSSSTGQRRMVTIKFSDGCLRSNSTVQYYACATLSWAGTHKLLVNRVTQLQHENWNEHTEIDELDSND